MHTNMHVHADGHGRVLLHNYGSCVNMCICIYIYIYTYIYVYAFSDRIHEGLHVSFVEVSDVCMYLFIGVRVYMLCAYPHSNTNMNIFKQPHTYEYMCYD